MLDMKEAIKQIQAIAYGAYQASGQAAALLNEPDAQPPAVAEALEQTAARMEQGTVELRALCESCLPPVPAIGQKPPSPHLDTAGTIEVNEFGWLHIRLNTLLPHCRFAPPLWLTQTRSPGCWTSTSAGTESSPCWNRRCWSLRKPATWIPARCTMKIIRAIRP